MKKRWPFGRQLWPDHQILGFPSSLGLLEPCQGLDDLFFDADDPLHSAARDNDEDEEDNQ